MCSRYELSVTPRLLAERFRLPAEPAELSGTDIRPTDLGTTIVQGADDNRHAERMRFGLAVSWSDGPLLHARAETIMQKSTFRPLLGRRCLVPASAYFEWRADGRRRLKNRIALASGRPMGFAALHDGDRFMIVTCAPAPAIAHIHDRMPAILPEAAEPAWLDAKRPFADIIALLAPYGAGTITFEEESPYTRQPDLFRS